MSDGTVARVAVTPEAAELFRSLRAQHGPLMVHQSGGCCDGSSPMCYPDGELVTGPSDVLVGMIHVGAFSNDGSPEPIAVWMSKGQFEYWSHTHLTIDVVDGRGAGFSLEAPTGRRFLIRSRLFTDDELPRLTPVAPGAL